VLKYHLHCHNLRPYLSRAPQVCPFQLEKWEMLLLFTRIAMRIRVSQFSTERGCRRGSRRWYTGLRDVARETQPYDPRTRSRGNDRSRHAGIYFMQTKREYSSPSTSQDR